MRLSRYRSLGLCCLLVKLEANSGQALALVRYGACRASFQVNGVVSICIQEQGEASRRIPGDHYADSMISVVPCQVLVNVKFSN